MMELQFESCPPQECGIPAEAVAELERRLEESRVRMHGYLLLSGKRIIAEKYRKPYGADTMHRMYSVTKSFVALAVGLLIEEGRLSPEDKICDFFPEKLPEGGAHPWCEEMTIRDMLSMRTCYNSTTYKRCGGDDWTESFFRAEPDHVPGTVFHYDTSSAHVLGALVEKLTGKTLLSYMRERFLDELGFSREAYIIKDPVGVSQGGSGLMCTLRDVARVAWLCSHYGVMPCRTREACASAAERARCGQNGRAEKELLPKGFLKEALRPCVPTDLQPVLDEQCGYGYLFWMPRTEPAEKGGQPEGGFVMYGMGGQLALCFPKRDFCFVTMADTIGNPAGVQSIYDCFYRTIFPHLEEKRAENPAAFEEAEKAAETDQSIAGRKTGREIFSCYANPAGWRRIVFEWDEGWIRFENGEEALKLEFGIGEECRRQQLFGNTGYRCECFGEWKMGHFILKCFVTDEEQGHVWMDFCRKDVRMSVRMAGTGEPFLARFRGSFSGEEIL